jgi:hypothetical protein
MPWTQQEIFDDIQQEKQSRAELSSLNTVSAVSITIGWQYVTSVILAKFKKFLDLFYLEIEAKAKAAQSGTREWYVQKAKEFQYGDTLQVINNIATYAVIDTEKQIIAAASITKPVNGISTLKVAKLVSAELQRLSDDEFTSFKSYIDRIMFAGSAIEVISVESDLLRIYGSVYYDALYTPDVVKDAVIIAIEEYVKNIDFDGVIKVSEISNTIQRVEGVTDVVITGVQAIPDGGSPVPVPRTYTTSSGYCKIDPANSLESTLTFNAE